MNFEEPLIFKEFIRYAGGAQANIVILPQASSLMNTGDEYCRKFREFGVKHKPVVLEFRERAEADTSRHLTAMRNATGVFIAGGTQMRIPPLIGGTALEVELLAAYRQPARGYGWNICGCGNTFQSNAFLWTWRPNAA